MGKQLHVTAGIPAFLNPATKLLPQSHTTKCTLLLFSPVWYSLKGCACRQASLYSQFSSVQWHVKLNYETRVSEDHNISGNTNTMPLLDTWSFYLFTHWWNHCLGKVSMWTRCILRIKSFDEMQESSFFNGVERQTINTNHFSNWPMSFLAWEWSNRNSCVVMNTSFSISCDDWAVVSKKGGRGAHALPFPVWSFCDIIHYKKAYSALAMTHQWLQ